MRTALLPFSRCAAAPKWIGLIFFSVLLSGIHLPARRLAAEQPEAALPAAADEKIDFDRQIRPLLESRCATCHSDRKLSGGLSMVNRQTLLKGGEHGAVVVPGNSAESLLIRRVAGVDSGRKMPLKGEPLSDAEIGLLRAWIDQGLPWPDDVVISADRSSSLQLRRPELPPADPERGLVHPIDRLLIPYFQQHGVTLDPPIGDRQFIRRATLDLVGLLPTPEQVEAFVEDSRPDKRARLIDRLLDDRRNYAEHWLTFWNDALRNAYRGAGYIDSGRRQITAWLYRSLYDNKPYDQFVRELIDPVPGSEGFTKGIVWRGTVNASQIPAMQAAQNLSQVFLGANIKCASCHDSFVNEWRLTDAYALAGVFADGPLEIHRCNQPTGKMATPGFIYPELGTIDPKLPRKQRAARLAQLLTTPENGRFARTMVNRLWAWFMGRGLIEPVDDMDGLPFSAELLDWLAVDLIEHGYDLKHTMRTICNSRVYQLPAVGTPAPDDDTVVFRGPLVRRMTAEQFVDAVSALTGQWQTPTPAMLKPDSLKQGGQLTVVYEIRGPLDDGAWPPGERASLAMADALQRALGRPNREQVVTRRESIATTLEALELNNGTTLDRMIRAGAQRWLSQMGQSPDAVIQQVYRVALAREATPDEVAIARQVVGSPPQAQGVEDLLWIVVVLPEFQLIY